MKQQTIMIAGANFGRSRVAELRVCQDGRGGGLGWCGGGQSLDMRLATGRWWIKRRSGAEMHSTAGGVVQGRFGRPGKIMTGAAEST